jgi:hypothetical protein
LEISFFSVVDEKSTMISTFEKVDHSIEDALMLNIKIFTTSTLMSSEWCRMPFHQWELCEGTAGVELLILQY